MNFTSSLFALWALAQWDVALTPMFGKLQPQISNWYPKRLSTYFEGRKHTTSKLTAIKGLVILECAMQLGIQQLFQQITVLKTTKYVSSPDRTVGLPACILCLETFAVFIWYLFLYNVNEYRPSSSGIKKIEDATGQKPYSHGHLRALHHCFNPWANIDTWPGFDPSKKVWYDFKRGIYGLSMEKGQQPRDPRDRIYFKDVVLEKRFRFTKLEWESYESLKKRQRSCCTTRNTAVDTYSSSSSSSGSSGYGKENAPLWGRSAKAAKVEEWLAGSDV